VPDVRAPSDATRTLFLISSLAQGGAERHLLELARHLGAGFDPAICVLRDSVHYSDDVPVGEPRFALRSRTWASPLAFTRLRAALEQFQPEILHCYLNDGNLWGRLASVRRRPPVVITSVHLDDMSTFYAGCERLLHRQSDRIVAHSASIAEMLVRRAGVPPEKITTILNGVDPGRFVPGSPEQRAVARQRFDLPPNGLVALMPARIAWQKNQDLVIEALGSLRERIPDDFRLVLAGRVSSGRLSRKVDRLIASHRLERYVMRLGAVSEMQALYHATDVVWLPSRTEASPIAAIEGLSAGLPVLISDRANTDRVVVPGVHGWQVTANDLGELEAAIAAIVATEPEVFRGFGAAGREHVERNFSNERVAREFKALYDELLSAKRG
jgi:glycosyltransferase involved in cell wall biosynthesis